MNTFTSYTSHKIGLVRMLIRLLLLLDQMSLLLFVLKLLCQFIRQIFSFKACKGSGLFLKISQVCPLSPVLSYSLSKYMTVETESMADRATKAALDAENEFKKFLDDLNQYEYMKVYDDDEEV